MDFWKMLEMIGISQKAFWTILIFLSSLFIEWRPEIKWNPWTALFKWIGSRFNKQIDNKLEKVREEIKDLDKKVGDLQTEVGKVQGKAVGLTSPTRPFAFNGYYLLSLSLYVVNTVGSGTAAFNAEH